MTPQELVVLTPSSLIVNIDTIQLLSLSVTGSAGSGYGNGTGAVENLYNAILGVQHQWVMKCYS